MKYLDSVALARLRNFRLEIPRLTGDGRLSGRHRSAWKGASREFAQHRPYAPGDELKTLDWKVYARQDRFYVRQYQAETVLSTQVLLDASGSMRYGSKWEDACRLALALSYLILSRGDSVGLDVFDTEPRERVPARAALAHLELMDSMLGRREPGGDTDLAATIERSAARIKRRALVILISDLMGDPDQVLKVARAVKARKNEVMVLHVLDPRERDFPFEGPVVFESLERQAPLFCDASAAARAYREEFRLWLRFYEAGFSAAQIPYGAFLTDQPWDTALGRLLASWQ